MLKYDVESERATVSDLMSPLCLLQDELDKNQVFIVLTILGDFRIIRSSETF